MAKILSLFLFCVCLFWAGGCATRDVATSNAVPSRPPDEVIQLGTLGFCDCEIYGGWEETHWGKKVISHGPNRGMPALVGVTSRGEKTGPGLIVANPAVFPYGTMMEVPGYGVGRVGDVQPEMPPDQVELWFKKIELVDRWGKQMVPVRVWYPRPR